MLHRPKESNISGLLRLYAVRFNHGTASTSVADFRGYSYLALGIVSVYGKGTPRIRC
jgi:hypothetical protein